MVLSESRRLGSIVHHMERQRLRMLTQVGTVRRPGNGLADMHSVDSHRFCYKSCDRDHKGLLAPKPPAGVASSLTGVTFPSKSDSR